MEYNNYYPAQPPPIPNQHMPGPNMMHPSVSPHNIRQVVTPVHQQMQQQQPPPQHLAHHAPPPPMPHQQHHPNYHQLPPHHPSPLSGSPHPQAQPSPMHQQANLNIQPPPRPSTGPSPQHNMHQQSPHHMTPGPPPHLQQQQPLNQMGGGPNVLLPPIVNQSQPGMQQHPHQPQTHNQNFMSHGPIPHPSPHYAQPPPHQPPQLLPPNQLHPPPPPLAQAQPPPPPMHHGPPPQPPPPGYIPAVHHHPMAMGRCSPFYQSIPQAEFRIIELNKRLQNRPRQRVSMSPLPIPGSSEESCWWEKFANDFFDDDSTITWRIPAGDKPEEYKIGRTLIPRFFRSYFEGGVIDLSIKLRNIRETAHNHLIILECDQADITTKNIFKHPSTNAPMHIVVHTEGHLRLEFVSNSFDSLSIKTWRFYANQSREYIDRSMTTFDMPSNCLIEPVTRCGLTKSTIFYLKMCMIMEPMQDLMLQHRQTKLDPRSCLKHLLVDKYKLKNIEDNRVQPNKRRKRRTPAATGTNKKSKANANNTNLMNNNNIGFNSMDNSLMSPSSLGGGMPNLPLASQDVMVVGEPSMLGADFGDENERRITRLENNQFESNMPTSGNSIDNSLIQNQSQMCNNANNNMNSNSRMQQQQQQQNNETGNNNIQLMNHSNSSNNISSNNGSIDTLGGSTNCLQNNNNNTNHQMNLVTMNGSTNHMGHIVKTEIDLKHSTSPLTNDPEAR